MKNEKMSELTKKYNNVKELIQSYNYILSDLKYKLSLKMQKQQSIDWWCNKYGYDMCKADIVYLKNQIKDIKLKLAQENSLAKEYKLKIKLYNKAKYCI